MLPPTKKQVVWKMPCMLGATYGACGAHTPGIASHVRRAARLVLSSAVIGFRTHLALGVEVADLDVLEP